MNVFTLAGIIGIVVIFVGVVLALLFTWLSRAVKSNAAELQTVQSDPAYNPGQTFGYAIPLDADVPEQLARARRLAAAEAARQQRGANMRIGPAEVAPLRTASQALDEDPQTAVRIAAFHTWQGAKTGPPRVSGVAPAAPAKQAAAPVKTKSPDDLVPGVDYPFIEVTDDMSPDEVRKARVANAKARSQAVKKLKEQGAAATAAPSAGAPGEPVVAAMEKVPPQAVKGIPEPEYIEITDDMSADEVRRARVANAKARSAYNKALKEAGLDPSQMAETREHPSAAPAATEASPQAGRPAEPTPATAREPVAAPRDDIPGPDYIEITDDMDPDEVRKARVQNAKIRSQFFKELKERGIDPKEWEAQQAAVADAAAEAGEKARAGAEPAAAAQPSPAVAGDGFELPANITPPNYIQVTGDMDADEVRQARVANARERSRFMKEVKEAGLDPKELPPELTQP